MTKMMETQKKSRDAATAKIGEILTADQTGAFEKLTGKPFDFSKITPGPPAGDPPPRPAAPKAEEEAPKKAAPAKNQPKTKTRKPRRTDRRLDAPRSASTAAQVEDNL